MPGWHGLAGMQGRGMPELGAVANGGVDVQDRVLADEHVRAEGDGTDLDDAGAGPVAVEVGIFTDYAARADGQQVGAHRHM